MGFWNLFSSSKVHDGYIVDKKGKKVQVFKVTKRYSGGASGGSTRTKTYTVDENGKPVYR